MQVAAVIEIQSFVPASIQAVNENQVLAHCLYCFGPYCWRYIGENAWIRGSNYYLGTLLSLLSLRGHVRKQLHFVALVDQPNARLYGFRGHEYFLLIR